MSGLPAFGVGGVGAAALPCSAAKRTASVEGERHQDEAGPVWARTDDEDPSGVRPRLPTLAEPGGQRPWACFSSALRKRYDAYVSKGNLEALASRASNSVVEPSFHDLASPPSADSGRQVPRPPR